MLSIARPALAGVRVLVSSVWKLSSTDAVSAAINARVAGTPFAQLGNYLFWIAFCFLGQPAAVLLYYVHCTGVLYQ